MTDMDKTAKNKQDVLRTLSESCGIVATACRNANVSRNQFYIWYKNDPDFREKVDDVVERQKDFVESEILKKIKDGDTTMIIFYAKTKMKDRGYSERHEITGKDGEDLIKSKEVDLSKLTDKEREVLLKLGQDIINCKE